MKMMKLHFNLLFGLLSGANAAGWTYLENDEFIVSFKPNFNTAEYRFASLEGEDQSTYKLKFSQFYETTSNGNKVGGSNIGLSSLTWSLENIVEGDEITFDIVGEGDKSGCGGFDEIRFQNTLFNDSFKFDLNITGYEFCGTAGEDDINLVYTLTGSSGGEDSADEEDDDDAGGKIVQENATHVYAQGTGAYFSIVDTADQNDEVGTVDVELDAKGNSIVTTYSGFEGGDLFHDPKSGMGNKKVKKKACFSPDATATVKGKGKVPMKDIAVGDLVLTGSKQYSSIYTIDHHHATKTTSYLQIDTNMEGEKPLEVTPSHMLFVEGESSPVPASTIKVGDAVKTLNGYQDVIGIKSILRNGVYNPITVDGTIVVDGVVASTYSAFSADDKNVMIGTWKTPISHHSFLHVSLTPLRALCMGVSSSLCETDEEYNAYSKFGVYVLDFILMRNVYVQGIFFAATLMFFGLMSCAPIIAGLYCYNKCCGKRTIQI